MRHLALEDFEGMDSFYRLVNICARRQIDQPTRWSFLFQKLSPDLWTVGLYGIIITVNT